MPGHRQGKARQGKARQGNIIYIALFIHHTISVHIKCEDLQHTISACIKCQDVQHTISEVPGLATHNKCDIKSQDVPQYKKCVSELHGMPEFEYFFDCHGHFESLAKQIQGNLCSADVCSYCFSDWRLGRR